LRFFERFETKRGNYAFSFSVAERCPLADKNKVIILVGKIWNMEKASNIYVIQFVQNSQEMLKRINYIITKESNNIAIAN